MPARESLSRFVSCLLDHLCVVWSLLQSTDRSDIGINELFDDRVQEFFIYDRSLQEQLPKKAPDRVVGLNATANFREILSRPVASAHTQAPRATIEDLVRISPFRSDADPLLFPFLLLEAKSEISTSSFDDIRIQSALPIQILLKLQAGLQSHQPAPDPFFNPLVWFLAFRGDYWRVYGCYLTSGAPVQYVGELPISFDFLLFEPYCWSSLS